MVELINNGSKEVILNIVRTHQLNSYLIDLIIPKSVYSTKKHLLTDQTLSSKQLDRLKENMSKIPSLYGDLLATF